MSLVAPERVTSHYLGMFVPWSGILQGTPVGSGLVYWNMGTVGTKARRTVECQADWRATSNSDGAELLDPGCGDIRFQRTERSECCPATQVNARELHCALDLHLSPPHASSHLSTSSSLSFDHRTLPSVLVAEHFPVTLSFPHPSRLRLRSRWRSERGPTGHRNRQQEDKLDG